MEENMNKEIQYIQDNDKIIANIYCKNVIKYNLFKKEHIDKNKLITGIKQVKIYAKEHDLAIAFPYEIIVDLYKQKEISILKEMENIFQDKTVICVYYNKE